MSIPDTSNLQKKLDRVLRERYLRDPIPGFRLPSEREMAREFDISVPTLRKAIERLSAEGLLERRQGSGTFVASSRANPVASKPVALVCNRDLAEIPHPTTLPRILSVCRQLLRAKGYRIRTYLGDETSGFHPNYAVTPEFLSDVRNDLLGGVIALATFPTAEWMEPLEKNRVPVVGNGELHRNMVTENHMIFVIKAAQLLLDRGRRRVAYIQGAPFQKTEDFNFDPGKSQVSDPETIRCLLDSLGLEVRENWFRNEWRIHSPSVGWSAFREIWSGKDRPDGVIVGNPMLAEGICRAARECGVAIPRDLVIVGNWPKEEISAPPMEMETLFSDSRKVGENLVEMLDEAIRAGSISCPRRIVNCLEIPDPEEASMPVPSLLAP